MYRISEFSKILGVTPATLRNWDKSGKLKPILLESGHRRYTELQLNSLLKTEISENRLNIIYCRESTKSQKTSLENQTEMVRSFCIKNGIRIDKSIRDFGSGLNFKREGFLELLDLATSNKISKLIIYCKDRLCRFGFEMFEELAKKYSFEIIIIDNTESKTKDKEFAEDLISIIHFFSMRLYGSRTYKKNLKAAEENIQKIKDEL